MELLASEAMVDSQDCEMLNSEQLAELKRVSCFLKRVFLHTGLLTGSLLGARCHYPTTKRSHKETSFGNKNAGCCCFVE